MMFSVDQTVVGVRLISYPREYRQYPGIAELSSEEKLRAPDPMGFKRGTERPGPSQKGGWDAGQLWSLCPLSPHCFTSRLSRIWVFRGKGFIILIHKVNALIIQQIESRASPRQDRGHQHRGGLSPPVQSRDLSRAEPGARLSPFQWPCKESVR